MAGSSDDAGRDDAGDAGRCAVENSGRDAVDDSKHAAVDDAEHAASGDPTIDADAAAALADALAAVDGDPTCARCPKPADYFLYEGDRVETFVCWEHVSPFSATVNGDEDAPDGRPVALSL